MKLIFAQAFIVCRITMFRLCLIIAFSISLGSPLNGKGQSTDKTAVIERYPICTVGMSDEPGMKLLVTRDTLLDEYAAREVLIARFSKLDSYITSQGLKGGKRILFTKCEFCALFLEAAIEVDMVPSKLPQDITVRYLDGGPFVIAHFEGSYDRIGIAYDAIARHVATNRWLTLDSPFEVFNARPYKSEHPNIIIVDVYHRIQLHN